jgi:CHASE2 domain-containing sensor protein/tRNA A-37 threonylcarbamoyl transferase component Bud32
MIKKKFWQTGWFTGLLISVLFLLSGWTDFMSQLEWRAYETGVRFSPAPTRRDNLEIIAIDEASLQQLGKWPWPRSYLGVVIKQLNAAGARIIGVALPLHTPQSEFGVNRLDTMRFSYEGQHEKTVKDILFLARQRLDTDGALAASLKKSDNTVLAISSGYGSERRENTVSGSKEILESFALPEPAVAPAGWTAYLPSVLTNGVAEVRQAQPPIRLLAKYSDAGMLDEFAADANSSLVTPLVLKYGDKYYPSFGLVFAALSRKLEPGDIEIVPGQGINLAGIKLDTDPAYRVYPRLYGRQTTESAFRVHSFHDIYSDTSDDEQPDMSRFRGKDVLIGITAPSLVDQMTLPGGDRVAPVMVTANVIDNLLHNDLYTVPAWALFAQLAVFAAIACYLIFILPRLGFWTGLVTSLMLLFVLVNAHFVLMIVNTMWVPLMLPAAALLTGALAIAVIRKMDEARQRTEAHLYESNLTLAQHLQTQGQLDQAFEKYRECAPGDVLLDRLYNLGLDYERRRQFGKAEMVFEHIRQQQPGYRDVKQRVQKNREVQNMVVLPQNGKHTAQGTLILTDGGLQKPMLGRYQVEKEIGRGAMGLVYLGRDPRIGRTVAIKTMALAQEFDADELEDVKARFLREAETAGRLNHQNIVTIYDVGEEQELAYIAMDYLQGHDLSHHKQPDTLLPLPTLLDIAIQVATALDFAHRHDVVHRDIKPANIIYDEESGNAKVTDFGVACLTSSSKTRTGTMLGSPSYMSPEQVSGSKVDGCSDLFSLGVTLYQLSTGKLPFVSDTMAGLAHKICNENPPDIRKLRDDIPACLVRIINKAMQKQKENRYKSGAQMAKSLRQCRETL